MRVKRSYPRQRGVDVLAEGTRDGLYIHYCSRWTSAPRSRSPASFPASASHSRAGSWQRGRPAGPSWTAVCVKAGASYGRAGADGVESVRRLRQAAARSSSQVILCLRAHSPRSRGGTSRRTREPAWRCLHRDTSHANHRLPAALLVSIFMFRYGKALGKCLKPVARVESLRREVPAPCLCHRHRELHLRQGVLATTWIYLDRVLCRVTPWIVENA